jgi:FkbM family methyltransferase
MKSSLPGNRFLGSSRLGNILEDISPLRCLDIGARGEPTEDLLPLAWAVELYGFEPDEKECDRLNNLYSSTEHTPFRKVEFFSVALGRNVEERLLYLTKHRGASSLLEPIIEIGREFSRSEYFTVERTSKVRTVPLDDFLARAGLDDAVYLKIDVEGSELEILQSAADLLSSNLMVIRAEVAFLKTRLGQPCYGEIESFLRGYHFIPMGFCELHHWRRLTKVKYPRKYKGIIPFSKGQISHGDMLFFRDPHFLRNQAPIKILKAAFLSMAYGYIDHAYYLLELPPVKYYLQDRYTVSVENELETVSRNLERKWRATKSAFFRSMATTAIQRLVSRLSWKD